MMPFPLGLNSVDAMLAASRMGPLATMLEWVDIHQRLMRLIDADFGATWSSVHGEGEPPWHPYQTPDKLAQDLKLMHGALRRGRGRLLSEMLEAEPYNRRAIRETWN